MKRARLHLYPTASAANAPLARTPARAQQDPRSLVMDDVLNGLRSQPKTLPCKYFYDAAGCQLFDKICELPEYYPTRTELEILAGCLPDVATMAGPQVQVVEYGSGSGIKTRMLLKALAAPTGCAMVEISPSYLDHCVVELKKEFPQLVIDPICADYTKPFPFPASPPGTRRRLAFFPGSTIGNFEPAHAREFLALLVATVGPGGGLLVGVDLKKDKVALEAAYDDAAGVTAQFNLNILRRIQRELHAEVNLNDYVHRAVWNDEIGRVEMHLVAVRNTLIKLAGEAFRLSQGETIHTENSYKYTVPEFAELALQAGLQLQRFWTDPKSLFSVQYYTVE